MIFTAVLVIGLSADRRVDIGAIASIRYEPSLPTAFKVAHHRPGHHKAAKASAAKASAAEVAKAEVLGDLDGMVGPPEPVRLAKASLNNYQAAETPGFCSELEPSVGTAAAPAIAPRPHPEVVVAKLEAVKEESGSASPAAQVGPQIPEPLRLARLSAAAKKKQASQERVADEEIEPKRAVVLAKPVSTRLARLDSGFVGPPLPGDYRSRHKAPAQSTVLAMLASYDDNAFVGPMRPVKESPAAHEHEHALPFNPLAEQAFAKVAVKAAAIPSALEELMATDDDLQTVRYIRDVKHRIRSGETFSEVLGTAGLSPREVDSWISATKAFYNVDRVYAGQEMELVLDMPEKQLKRMKLEVGHDAVVVVEETAAGVVARREDIQYERRLRVVGGVIDHSLYVAAVEKGIPDRVISDVAEILGWEVNFGRDLRPGDMFRIIYEELTRVDTMEQRAGRVLAVEIVSRGKSHEAFYYRTNNRVDSGYYNRKGEGLGRAFLRYPVAFSRISSQFSNGRFHPVLKRRIPHYGVDFAAATGTPVKAVADGTVLRAGWFRGNGRFVKLRHDSVYESGYAHLSRIPSNIKLGVKVNKGDIIGYVGSTGLATGPHLHFALYRRGKYIDPLKADLPRARSLSGQELAGFHMKIDMMDRAYAEGGEGTERSTQVAALPVESREELSE